MRRERLLAATRGRDNIHRRVTLWQVPRLMKLTIQGSDYLVFMYTVRLLAERLNRTKQAVVKMERNEILPRPIWIDDKGTRLYTEDQVAVIERAHNYCLVHEKNVWRWRDSQFTSFVLSGYSVLIQGVDMERYLAMQPHDDGQVDSAQLDGVVLDDEISRIAKLRVYTKET